uniref:Uncharacterized protein n=1 Tax=Anopheles farauti TaxID=69004 RepID=A0A182QPR5_9DIPT
MKYEIKVLRFGAWSALLIRVLDDLNIVIIIIIIRERHRHFEFARFGGGFLYWFAGCLAHHDHLARIRDVTVLQARVGVRWGAHEHLVHQQPEREHVRLRRHLVMLLAAVRQHLRGQPEGRADVVGVRIGGPINLAVRRHLDADAKVAQLHHLVVVLDQHVVRLDVAMDQQCFGVKVDQGAQHIHHHLRRVRYLQRAELLIEALLEDVAQRQGAVLHRQPIVFVFIIPIGIPFFILILMMK